MAHSLGMAALACAGTIVCHDHSNPYCSPAPRTRAPQRFSDLQGHCHPLDG